MKIAILTLPLNYNYGCILQAYALQTVLGHLGNEVEVIKWEQPEFKGFPIYKALFIYGKRLLTGKELCREYREGKERRIIWQNVQESIGRLIHYSLKAIASRDELISYCHSVGYDVFIVGSDQVWRKSYGDKSIFNRLCPRKSFPSLDTFFLDFVTDFQVKPIMISYAASFGVNYAQFSEEESDYLGKFLSRFNAVSVREEQGVSLIKDIYKWKVNAHQVLDPTMLLNAKDYFNLLVPMKERSPFLLYYVLDNTTEKIKMSKTLSVRYSLSVVTVSPNERNGSPQSRILPSVEEWLSLFADASFILTDSFHGMIFSIIFNKQFYVIGNPKRGMSRFESLLSLLGLSKRLIINDELLKECDELICWSEVMHKLEAERIKSLEFLNLV